MKILYYISVVSPPPNFCARHLEDGCTSSKCFKGLYADIFHSLQESLNFTFTIQLVKSFGGMKNGTWTGMIGNIIYMVTEALSSQCNHYFNLNVP